MPVDDLVGADPEVSVAIAKGTGPFPAVPGLVHLLPESLLWWPPGVVTVDEPSALPGLGSTPALTKGHAVYLFPDGANRRPGT